MQASTLGSLEALLEFLKSPEVGKIRGIGRILCAGLCWHDAFGPAQCSRQARALPIATCHLSPPPPHHPPLTPIPPPTLPPTPQVAIPVSAINIGPVHKKDVMRANVMIERGVKKFGVILAFDVPGGWHFVFGGGGGPEDSI